MLALERMVATIAISLVQAAAAALPAASCATYHAVFVPEIALIALGRVSRNIVEMNLCGGSLPFRQTGTQ